MTDLPDMTVITVVLKIFEHVKCITYCTNHILHEFMIHEFMYNVPLHPCTHAPIVIM